MASSDSYQSHGLMRSPTGRSYSGQVDKTSTESDFIDLGLPIPESYDREMLSVLVQSPNRLFAFWQISSRAWSDLEQVFGASDLERFHTVVTLRHPATGWHQAYPAGGATSWWFDVHPGELYEVEIGFRSAKHGYTPWARSRPVRTPRAGPGDERLTPTHPPPVGPQPPPEKGREEPEAMPQWLDELPGWLGQLVHKLSRGDQLSDAEIRRLPEWVQSPLLSLWRSVGPEAMRRALLEYVPELVHKVSPETYQRIIEHQRQGFPPALGRLAAPASPPFGHRWFSGPQRPGSRPGGAPGSLFGPGPGGS